MRSERHATAGYPLASTLRASAAGKAVAAEEPFRALLEAIPDAMLIVEGTGIIRLVNARAETLFGYPREDLAGRSGAVTSGCAIARGIAGGRRAGQEIPGLAD